MTKTRLESLLCPVDFSEQSRHALRWAGALAERFEARLRVFTAVEPLLAEAARTRFRVDLVSSDTEPALREFVAATSPALSGRAELEVVIGAPAEAIVQAAKSSRTDLVVMGTHGLGGVRKLLLGSTTERVLRHTPVPVLTIPPTSRTESATGPDLGNLGRVLAATDFSEAAEGAVRWAAALAEDLGLPLLLVHIVRPIAVPAEWARYLAEADEARIGEAQKRLERSSRSFADSPAVEIAVQLGHPAQAIPALAKERSAGLIVMGLASEQGPWSPRPGSVASRVLGAREAPVLVVPLDVAAWNRPRS